MLIRFYYIKGISLTDTLYFQSLTAQSTYFITHTVTTIDTTFYPPHYRNSIKIEKTDISPNTAINYLSFTYQGKEYYYFIDNVRYINEDVYALDIEMDTIQTYMFNIVIESCHIDRKFIDRYNNALFNRSYIRENFSSADFKLERDIMVDKPVSQKIPTLGWFIIKKASASDVTNIETHYDSDAYSGFDDVITSGFIYQFIPVMHDYAITMVKADGTELGEANSLASINYFAKDPNVLDIQYAPWNIFDDDIVTGWSADPDTETATVTFASNNEIKRIKDDTGEYYSIVIEHTSSIPYYPAYVRRLYSTTTYTLPASKNTSKGVKFQSQYVPAMIDNNYIRIGFGEGTQLCSVDLYGVTGRVLYLESIRSPFMIRKYMIKPENMLTEYSSSVFTMQSYITISETSTYDLINDSYATWRSQNTFTGINAALKDTASFMKDIRRGGGVNIESGQTVVSDTDYASYTSRPTVFLPNGGQQAITGNGNFSNLIGNSGSPRLLGNVSGYLPMYGSGSGNPFANDPYTFSSPTIPPWWWIFN